MAATLKTAKPKTRAVEPPPTEEEVVASGAYERLAEGDPWEGFTEEDRARGWREVTREEGRSQFDRAVRLTLGISGEEFIRRWDAGEYRDWADKSNYRYLMDLGMMIPLARQES